MIHNALIKTKYNLSVGNKMTELNGRQVVEVKGEYVICKGVYGFVVTDILGNLLFTTPDTVRQARILINKQLRRAA